MNSLRPRKKHERHKENKGICNDIILNAVNDFHVMYHLRYACLMKILYIYNLDCPLSKGNQALYPKFERPNRKISKSENFLTAVKNWCVQLT